MRYKRTRVHSPERGQNPRYAHRLAAEQKLGRSLEPREVVHHRNGDKLNFFQINSSFKCSTKQK